MATISFESGTWRVRFWHADRQYKRSLKTTVKRDAERHLGRIEDTLKDIGLGRLQVPADVDAADFIMNGGKTTFRTLALGKLADRYLAEFTTGGKEANTIATERLHLGHLRRILKDKTTHILPQRYIDERAKEGVARVTIGKEIATLRYLLNWGLRNGHIAAVPSFKGLSFPRAKEKAPFRTLDECERLGGTPFLNPAEIAEFLDHAQTVGPWEYAVVCVAAMTGARRSEIRRMVLPDDIHGGKLRFREKKRIVGEDSGRTVTMTPRLAAALHGLTGRAFNIPTTTFRERLSAVFVGKWHRVRLHSLRHSFVSCLAASGASESVIAALVGHMTREMQEHYRHMFPKQMADAVLNVFG